METATNSLENALLVSGSLCYVCAALLEVRGALRGGPRAGRVAGLLCLGVVLLALTIAERWVRVGYGPFLTLYEVLLSNLFSLGLIYTIAYWLIPVVRRSAVVAFPIILVLLVWAQTVPRAASHLPATYHNPWLWVHVGTGKLFLGVCLVAVSLAGVLILQLSPRLRARLGDGPQEAELNLYAWRFLGLAFVFHSLMLIAGAVWAQDAWGRYWAWDPLETWAFMTWLAMAIALHARLTFPIPAWSGWLMMVGVFVLAILTFFGVPFLSHAPHKGAV